MDRVISEFSKNGNKPAEAGDIAFIELSDLQLAIVGGGCAETIL